MSPECAETSKSVDINHICVALWVAARHRNAPTRVRSVSAGHYDFDHNFYNRERRWRTRPRHVFRRSLQTAVVDREKNTWPRRGDDFVRSAASGGTGSRTTSDGVWPLSGHVFDLFDPPPRVGTYWLSDYRLLSFLTLCYDVHPVNVVISGNSKNNNVYTYMCITACWCQ